MDALQLALFSRQLTGSMLLFPLRSPVSMTNTRRKRWFQISLRTFLLVLTIGCVWLGFIARKAARQRKAVEWIAERSGRAWYDFQIDNPRGLPVDLRAEPPGPAWLRERIGLDYFADLRWVEVKGASDISRLSTLYDLHELHVDNSSVSDVSPLKNLKSLRQLFLRYSPVSDITPLAGMSNLDHLSLNDTDVRDVTPLYQLKGRKSLNLQRTLVDEQGFEAISRALPDCRIVWSHRANSEEVSHSK